jgi:hypothetical protein
MRVVRRLVIALLVLGVLLVVVDRVGAWAAQRVVADRVASELAGYQVDSAPPEVTIDRVPFLTQVAAGRYGSVTLRLRDVDSGGLRLPLVVLTATGVTAPTRDVIAGEGRIDAERVDGTATIGYADVVELTRLEGLSLSAAGDGALRVRLPTELPTGPVTLVGTGELTATGAAIRVRVTELTVEEPSGLPPGAESVVAELARRLSVEVPLPPLPYGLTVESVRAEPAGLVVGVTARDVPLAR